MSSSSSPPDPWREPQDPDASSPDWGRPPRPSGAPAAPGPFGAEPASPPNYLQQGGDWWTPRQAEQGPRTGGWDPQGGWGDTQGGGWDRQGGGGWGPPPGQGWPQGAPTGEPAPYTDPYGPPTGTGQYPPQGYPPDPYQGDPYQQGPPSPYPPYPPDPYGQQAPMDDPYGMWGGEQPWEEHDPSHGEPPRRRRKWPLAVLGAVTAIIAIVVFVPAVQNLLRGGDSAQAVALGQPVADGTTEFTVARVECGQTQLDGSEILAQEIFCVLHLTTTNNGEAPVVIDVQSQQIFDENDQPLAVNQEWLAVPNRSYSQEIAPGQSVDGVVIYDAPAGTEPSRVELRAAADSEGATVEVSGG